jgi:small conductance mechanosensitive channel
VELRTRNLRFQQVDKCGEAMSETAAVRDGFAQIWAKLDVWLNDFIGLIPNIIVSVIVAALFFVLSWAASVLVRHVLHRRGRRDLGHMLASFTYWLVLFLGFLVVITILLPSVHTADLLASLGIGSLALGFALKDILQNWIAGFLILLRRPFRRGDQIKVGDIEGTVQAVETRATLVKTYSGRLVIIPNSEIYTHSVTVSTAYEVRRSELTVPVGLETPLELVITTFQNAVREVPDVLADPPPDVLPWEFKDNNVNVLVRWWTKPQRAFEVRTRASVMFALKQAAEKEGVSLPADTKISFAETPLITTTRKPKEPRKAPAPEVSCAAVEQEAAPSADTASNPETETPLPGELSEGVELVPR